MPIYQQYEGGPWWASISTKGKGRTRVSLKTTDRAEAEERYKILERRAWVEGCDGLVQAAPETLVNMVRLQDVYDRALKTHYTKAKDINGVHNRWESLVRFINPNMEVKAITTKVAWDVFLAMKVATWTRGPNGTPHPYSPASINRCMSLLGKLLHFAHAEMDGALSVVPKMPKCSEAKALQRRALRADELVLAVNALDCHPIPSWRACADLLRVLWGTGCRVGELMPKNFAWAQVDFDNESLHWDDTKSGHAVAKPMTVDVRAVLKAEGRGLEGPVQ
ncbi:MAG: hypothetical protein QM749_04420 [Aquabacterium sp.]